MLNDPWGAIVGPNVDSTTRSRSLVLVLPDEPVRATTCNTSLAPMTARASRPAATTVSSTRMCGPATARETNAATPPEASAPATWS